MNYALKNDLLGKRFIHNGIIYDFKIAKLNYILRLMPSELRTKMRNLIALIFSDDFPERLFNDKNIVRCSRFRVKNLKRGYRKIIERRLIESESIGVYQTEPERQYHGYVPSVLKELADITNKYYNKRINDGYIKPGHEEILTFLMLRLDTAFATEFPLWTKRQQQISDFFIKKRTNKPQKKENMITLDLFAQRNTNDTDSKKSPKPLNSNTYPPNLLNFNYKMSITGHIDLLLYDPSDRTIIVADYKPEGNFIYSIPQIITYGLMLKRVLGIDKNSPEKKNYNIKCASFNKESVWYYDPNEIRDKIEEEIRLAGDPQLPWRKYIDSL